MEILNRLKPLLLIAIISFLSIDSFAQQAPKESTSYKNIHLPIVNIGVSGHTYLTGKYDLSVRTFNKLYVNLYYGNHSLDYLHLAYTIGEKWYGAGLEYYFSRYKNTF